METGKRVNGKTGKRVNGETGSKDRRLPVFRFPFTRFFLLLFLLDDFRVNHISS
jgi:hypothetical protein